MQNKNSDKSLNEIVEGFIKKLIAAGQNTAEISFTLAEQATILGIEVAPSTELAMIVVMDGIKSGCASRVSTDEETKECADEIYATPISVTLH